MTAYEKVVGDGHIVADYETIFWVSDLLFANIMLGFIAIPGWFWYLGSKLMRARKQHKVTSN